MVTTPRAGTEQGLAATAGTVGLVPVPDPTTLTNALVERAISALREITDTRMTALEGRIEATDVNQVRHIDIAVRTLQSILEANIHAVQALMEEKIGGLCETVAVFKTSVGDRFELLDKQTIKAAADVKSAVDAAFAAAASGVAQQNQANFLASQKQEAAFTKQIDQLQAGMAMSLKAADEKINDLKDRIVEMSGRSSGSVQTIGWSIGAAGLLIALTAVILAVLHVTH